MRPWTIITFAGAMSILIGQPPGSAQTLTTYRCRDGSEFVLGFYDYDRRAHLQLDGKVMALSKRVALSGTRYSKGGTALRITKTGTTLKRGKRSTECMPN